MYGNNINLWSSRAFDTSEESEQKPHQQRKKIRTTFWNWYDEKMTFRSLVVSNNISYNSRNVIYGLKHGNNHFVQNSYRLHMFHVRAIANALYNAIHSEMIAWIVVHDTRRHRRSFPLFQFSCLFLSRQCMDVGRTDEKNMSKLENFYEKKNVPPSQKSTCLFNTKQSQWIPPIPNLCYEKW